VAVDSKIFHGGDADQVNAAFLPEAQDLAWGERSFAEIAVIGLNE